MSKKPEQMTLDLSERGAVQAVERKGSHVITKGATVYLSGSRQICWISIETAYCDRLNKKKESAVRLKEPLRVYRDGEYLELPVGRILYVARNRLIRA